MNGCYFKDSAGQMHPIQDVNLILNGGRGTWRGKLATDHTGGRGWLIQPGFAPVAVAIEQVEPPPANSLLEDRGLLTYRFLLC